MSQYDSNTHRKNPFYQVSIVIGALAAALMLSNRPGIAASTPTSPVSSAPAVTLTPAATQTPAAAPASASSAGIRLGGTSWRTKVGAEGGFGQYADLEFFADGGFREVIYIYYDTETDKGYTLTSVIEGTYSVSGNRLSRKGTGRVPDDQGILTPPAPYEEEYFIEIAETGEGEKSLRLSYEEGYKGVIYTAAEPRFDWASDLSVSISISARKNGWGAIYAGFLKAQNFKMKGYLFHNDRMFFPTHSLEGEVPAVMQAMFYENPEFTAPVMVLVEFLELASRPGELDTFPIEIAYVIKDGAVTRDMTEAERAAVFGERPKTGMRYVKGEPLQTFVLARPVEGDTKAVLDELYMWLVNSVQ